MASVSYNTTKVKCIIKHGKSWDTRRSSSNHSRNCVSITLTTRSWKGSEASGPDARLIFSNVILTIDSLHTQVHTPQTSNFQVIQLI